MIYILLHECIVNFKLHNILLVSVYIDLKWPKYPSQAIIETTENKIHLWLHGQGTEEREADRAPPTVEGTQTRGQWTLMSSVTEDGGLWCGLPPRWSNDRRTQADWRSICWHHLVCVDMYFNSCRWGEPSCEKVRPDWQWMRLLTLFCDSDDKSLMRFWISVTTSWCSCYNDYYHNQFKSVIVHYHYYTRVYRLICIFCL